MSALGPHQRRVLQAHLDPVGGSRYWTRVARERGVQAADLESTADLARLGRFDIDALRTRPVEDFVPRAIREGADPLTPCCTGGATAAPAWTVFTPGEFERAFVRPFERACEWSGFPRGGRWLFLGPSGSHPIGRGATASALACGAGAPFAIDLDPRWARSLAPGSFARERYVDHIVRQATEIIAAQGITVIFATAPILARLATTLPASARNRVRGVHHGGTAISAAELTALQAAFRGAVFLAGYGNSLLGMSPEVPAAALPTLPPRDAHLLYATDSERLSFRLVDGAAAQTLDAGRDPTDVEIGVRGRLLVSRFDESFLLCNHLERDEAIHLPPTALAAAARLAGPTLGDPRPLQEVTRIGGEGLY